MVNKIWTRTRVTAVQTNEIQIRRASIRIDSRVGQQQNFRYVNPSRNYGKYTVHYFVVSENIDRRLSCATAVKWGAVRVGNGKHVGSSDLMTLLILIVDTYTCFC